MTIQIRPLFANIPLLESEIHIHLVRLDGLLPPPGWETSLVRGDWNRAAHLRFDRDRDRFLRKRFLLRSFLSAYLKIPAQDLAFECLPGGKPQLAGYPIHFNVSGSGVYCALAFSCLGPLGIDVEQIRPLRDILLVIRHYFSIPEQAALAEMTSERKFEAFYHIWTQKEAFLKAIGKGLSFPLDLLDVEPNPDLPGNLLGVRGFPELRTQWMIHSLVPLNGYRFALCHSKSLPKVKVFHFREFS